jgi:uncharacterized protein YfaP (DUF2135 family)
VQGLPGGNQVVLAGWSQAFTGIQGGTVVTLTYQASSECAFFSWWVSSGPTPTGNPISVTVNSDREVIALCLPVRIQVNITSPQDGSTATERLITVTGTVESDNPIEEATISRDGESRSLELTYEGSGSYLYSFETQLELHQGWNTITVTATDTQDRSSSDTIDVYANIPIIPIRIELTWDTDYTDVDSHFIAPGYEWESFGDCYFGNMNPDWDWSNEGYPDGSAGDPQLDVDDTDGYGPEYTVLQDPPFNGIYQFKVHYFSDDGYGATTARVRIWINDVLSFNQTRLLTGTGYIWDCACISWPAGTVSAGPCVIPTPTPTPAYTLTVTNNGCWVVYVSGYGEVYSGGNATFDLPEGTQVTLTPSDGDGIVFTGWYVDEEVSPRLDNPLIITMNDDHDVTAVCVPEQTLTVHSWGCCDIEVTWAGGNETVLQGGNGTFFLAQGTLVTFYPIPVGVCFVCGACLDNPECQEPLDPLEITMDADHEVWVYCSEECYGVIIG